MLAGQRKDGEAMVSALRRSVGPIGPGYLTAKRRFVSTPPGAALGEKGAILVGMTRLAGRVPELRPVGDAASPRRTPHAILDGPRAARAL
jgi:hypothetical protein